MVETKKANTKKNTTTKKANTKSKATEVKSLEDKSVITTEETNSVTPIKAYKVKPDIPLTAEVVVTNGYHGRLVYKGRKSGEHLEWENFGDEQIMELKELKDARASQKKFFTANWWLIDNPDIIEFLNASEFYKYAVNAENYDDIFKKPVEEIEAIVSELTDGQKKSMAYRAIELINSGKLDSRKTIDALKNSLGFELIEE